MKKILIIIVITIFLSGCTQPTIIKLDTNNGNKNSDTSIKINSLKKVYKDCDFYIKGVCHEETTPENDYFLIVDLIIEHKGPESILINGYDFSLLDEDGKEFDKIRLDENISSYLIGSVLPNDKLKGQIAFDVKDMNKFVLRRTEEPLKSFSINKKDIVE